MSSIHWPLAARVAGGMAGTHPLEGTYHFAALTRRAPEHVDRAAGLVAAETGLPWVGSPEVRVVTRVQWAEANISAFGRLLAPAEKKLAARSAGGLGGKIGSRLLAAEVGALVGVLAKRVLGQYELVLPAGDDTTGDAILFAGANVLQMERQHEFRPDEFRFWVALHECTHRLQFTGVPWMRAHFSSLVDQLVVAAEPEPGKIQRLGEEMREASREGRPLVDESGLMGLLATPDQRRLIERVQALMALLEGHGHVIMDRIGARELVTQDRMSRVLKLRRQDPRARAFFRITGLEMKMKQYELGQRFILGVERRAGFGALDVAWSGPEALPSLEEISHPEQWLARVG
ncbi:MAG: zinc-dependent metalloprotease [Acidimicrobiia bacterium]|nr:zinc-dependent metalloprotease [Acidimicrobiia bacterium]